MYIGHRQYGMIPTELASINDRLALRCIHTKSFLLLVTSTLESIFGPLSHVKWVRLILSIWQPCLLKCGGSKRKEEFKKKKKSKRDIRCSCALISSLTHETAAVQQVARNKNSTGAAGFHFVLWTLPPGEPFPLKLRICTVKSCSSSLESTVTQV